MPIVTGEGKRSRLLGTIGVTRGFGDHDLRALGSGILIKPFLSAHPEVTCRDLTKVISVPGDDNEDGDYGVLVMATDGLWDVSEIEAVSRTVFDTLDKYPRERHRYTMVAQELVAKARGRINESGHWRLADSKAAATVDDISVLVVPVYQYYKEYVEWERQCFDKDAEEAKEEEEEEEEMKVENGHSGKDFEVEGEEQEEEEEKRIDAEIAAIAEQLRSNSFEGEKEKERDGGDGEEDEGVVGGEAAGDSTEGKKEEQNGEEEIEESPSQSQSGKGQAKNKKNNRNNNNNNSNRKKANKESSPEH